MSATDTTNANGLPTVHRPCPPWCELKAGHGWDSEDGPDVEIRGHGLTIGTIQDDNVAVSIYNLESSTAGGASTFTPVVITVDSPPSGAELNAEQARELAALLVLAADQVETLLMTTIDSERQTPEHTSQEISRVVSACD